MASQHFKLRGYYAGGATRPKAYLISVYGQSLGQRYAPRQTTTAVADTYVPSSGASQTGDETPGHSTSQTRRWADMDGAFTAFTENSAGEGWGPGIADTLNAAAGAEKSTFYSAAIGAKHWRELSPWKGTWSWGSLHLYLDRAWAWLADMEGYAASEIQPVFIWVHGESDADDSAPGGGSESKVTQAKYENILDQVVEKYRLSIQSAAAAVVTAPTFVAPMLTASTDTSTSDGTRAVQNAHIAKHADGTIILLPSPAQFAEDYDTDLTHMGGAGKRLYAEACGLAIRAHFDGSYDPLYMTDASRSGTTVTVTFNADIEIDTTTVDEIDATNYPHQNKGFQFYDGTSTIDITNVTVSGDQATLTIASTPSGAEEVRMAQQEWIQPPSTGAVDNMPRSNIRKDVKLGDAVDATELYDFALPQSIAVT